MTALVLAVLPGKMDKLKLIQIGVLFFGAAALFLFRRRASGIRLPPGPKGLPIIGNLLDLPPTSKHEYLHWLKHKDLYGPISSVTVLGQTIVIIHGKQEAHDVLEKHSLKTAERPGSPFSRLCGYERFILFRDYDEVFRTHRKLVHQQLGTTVNAARMNDIQEIESHRFLWRILNSPDRFPDHLKT
jgi:fumagillin biosynthesis cytochrome P450 monooxygenase